MFAILAVFAQAALPPSGLPYDGQVEFLGPGVVCGSAFSLRLEEGETAVLTKRTYVDAEYRLRTRDGVFNVHEHQYATQEGKVVRLLPDGALKRKRESGSNRWSYTDDAPGSTDVYGPAVDTRRPSPALNRLMFGAITERAVDGERCLEGLGLDPKVS